MSDPSTVSQWQEAMLEIKRLHLKQQYRKCVQESTILLRRPQTSAIHTCALNFYAALSYECIAEPINNSSVSKLDYLNMAADFYAAALRALKLAAADPGCEVSLPGSPERTVIFHPARIGENIEGFARMLHGHIEWITQLKQEALAFRETQFRASKTAASAMRKKGREARRQEMAKPWLTGHLERGRQLARVTGQT